ncbi:MAG: agglutinin biogenesis protein MshP [Gammaproteobacteria bacterium]|nr:agglutinin biogenesis protein MshP [Gammaproteobacteria bacterium]MBU1645908.1 agglutinin biogenesis protein MshP [Gammaproteobacteria bacterium]MBU1971970.1 agglutinin biogenesis protein MshP [Gammaproteobacteria bacterium]
MCPDRPWRARGFALISAIFILVVLSALAGFIATVSTTQHVGSALDVMSARAFQASRAGLQWGLFQALQPAPSCVASADIGNFNGIAVTVQCTELATGNGVEAGLGSLYRVTAIACAPAAGTTCPGPAGANGYVERRMTALAER